jgi:hypothetical protein
VLHAFAAKNFSGYDNELQGLPCGRGDPPPGCAKDDPDLIPLNARLKLARREQAVAVGGYIGGGLLMATGAVLLYLNRPHISEQGNTNSFTKSVIVTPVVSNDSFSVSIYITH